MKKIAVVTAFAMTAGVLVSCGNSEAPPMEKEIIVYKYELNGDSVVEWNTKIYNDRCIAIKHNYGYSLSCVRN